MSRKKRINNGTRYFAAQLKLLMRSTSPEQNCLLCKLDAISRLWRSVEPPKNRASLFCSILLYAKKHKNSTIFFQKILWVRKDSDLRCFICHGFTVRCVRRCATDPYGGTGWVRASDTLGFNQVLYHLSYGSVWRRALDPTQIPLRTRSA